MAGGERCEVIRIRSESICECSGSPSMPVLSDSPSMNGTKLLRTGSETTRRAFVLRRGSPSPALDFEREFSFLRDCFEPKSSQGDISKVSSVVAVSSENTKHELAFGFGFIDELFLNGNICPDPPDVSVADPKIFFRCTEGLV
jgi:hypothetical protein